MGGVKGITHLWFITAILLCYAVTPVLQPLRKYSDVIMFVLLIAGVAEYGFIQYDLGKFQWFYLYSLGYFYANACRRTKLLVVTVAALLLVYMLSVVNWQIITDYECTQNRLFHSVLGFFICIVGIRTLQSMSIGKNRFVKQLDALSFPIYITHHVFALGAFSVLSLTAINALNVTLFVFLSVASAFILAKASAYVSNYINQKIRI